MCEMAPIPSSMLASIASDFVHDEAIWDASRNKAAQSNNACLASAPERCLFQVLDHTPKLFLPAPQNSYKGVVAKICNGRNVTYDDCTLKSNSSQLCETTIVTTTGRRSTHRLQNRLAFQ